MERTGRLGQIKVYVGKFCRIFMNEKDWKVLIFAVLISLILSPVLGGNMFRMKEATIEGSFTIISSCIWIGIFNSIQTVCREREIIKREHRTGLHISSYIAAHMIYQAGICILQALLMVIIYGFFMEVPKKGLVTGNFYVDLFFIFLLALYASDMMGLAVSSIVKTTTAAMTVMPFLLIIQLVFSGTIFPLSGPAQKISDLTISKWGQRTLVIEANVNELPSDTLVSELKMFRQVEGLDAIIDLIPKEDIEKFTTEHTRRAIYNYDRDLVVRRWLYLLLFSFIYAAVALVSLEFIDHDKR